MLDWRVIYILWYRDLLRYWRNKIRMAVGLFQPFMWLFLFGSGMSSAMTKANGFFEQFSYIKFLFAGIMGLGILFPSVFIGSSIVTDREFGFLKEVLVAPVNRVSIVFGRALGGATTTTLQVSLMFLLIPLMKIDISFLEIILLLPVIFLLAFAMSSYGILLGSLLGSSDAFHAMVNFLIMPMFILSGAFFPLNQVPQWLGWLLKLNPLAYGVDILRKIIFWNSNVSVQLFGISIAGIYLSLWTELLLIAIFAAIMHIFAAWAFERS